LFRTRRERCGLGRLRGFIGRRCGFRFDWRRFWRLVAGLWQDEDLAGVDEVGVTGLDVAVLVRVDDLTPVGGDLGVGRLAPQVDLESTL
jgi:hypothetical protein